MTSSAAVGLNEFFIAIVIVAIGCGRARQHNRDHQGGTPSRNRDRDHLSMQVAVFVAPAVAVLSWLVGRGLPLSFRFVELATAVAADSRWSWPSVVAPAAGRLHARRPTRRGRLVRLAGGR